MYDGFSRLLIIVRRKSPSYIKQEVSFQSSCRKRNVFKKICVPFKKGEKMCPWERNVSMKMKEKLRKNKVRNKEINYERRNRAEEKMEIKENKYEK